jgi:hypothetical protein
LIPVGPKRGSLNTPLKPGWYTCWHTMNIPPEDVPPLTPPNSTSTRRNLDPVWNLLTVVCFGLTAVCCLTSLWIFINPDSSLNPFPPSTQPTLAVSSPALLPFGTPTLSIPTLPPEWTTVPLSSPGAGTSTLPTATPSATNTLSLQVTATTFIATPSVEASATSSAPTATLALPDTNTPPPYPPQNTPATPYP